MSDKVVIPPNAPAAKKPLEQVPVAAPESTSAARPATATPDDKGRFQVVDPGLKQAQAKIQPPAMQTVVPASRAGRKTKEDLKTNLLLGQLSSRPAPRGKKVGPPPAELDGILKEKAAIVDQKSRVRALNEDAQAEAYQGFAPALYEKYPRNVRCKFVQGAHLPPDNAGVCAAMAVHWGERTLRGKQSRYSFADETGSSPKQLRQKFEDLVADQALAGGGDVAKAALRAGLQIVDHSKNSERPSKKYGDPLFNNRERTAQIESAKSRIENCKFRIDHNATEVAGSEQDVSEWQAKVAKASAVLGELGSSSNTKATGATDKQRKKLQERLTYCSDNLANATRKLERDRKAPLELPKEIEEAKQTIAAAELETGKKWVEELNAKLEPDKTYVISLSCKGAAHAVAFRTGPGLVDPPAGGLKFAHLDVMDANNGEFHFDNKTPQDQATCCNFLKQFGTHYMIDMGYDKVVSRELKPA